MARIKIKPNAIAIVFNDGVFVCSILTWDEIYDYENRGYEVRLLV